MMKRAKAIANDGNSPTPWFDSAVDAEVNIKHTEANSKNTPDSFYCIRILRNKRSNRKRMTEVLTAL